MSTIAELSPADAPAELPTILAALTHDATDPNWACTVVPAIPPADMLLGPITTSACRAIVVRQSTTIVGFTTMDPDGRLGWLILDIDQFATLLAELCDWILTTYGVNAWGTVEDNNQRFATMDADPNVAIESVVVEGDRFAAVVRWQP
jgi:hypothetical protein